MIIAFQKIKDKDKILEDLRKKRSPEGRESEWHRNS